MKKLLIPAILTVAVGFASCRGNHAPVKHGDSMEYAVYASSPIADPEDCEPLYIPVDVMGAYEAGDIVFATDNGMLVEFPLRDAESHQPVLDGLHKVFIQKRVGQNKWFKAGKN